MGILIGLADRISIMIPFDKNILTERADKANASIKYFPNQLTKGSYLDFNYNVCKWIYEDFFKINKLLSSSKT